MIVILTVPLSEVEGEQGRIPAFRRSETHCILSGSVLRGWFCPTG
jgi:hypothetical protein